MSSASVNSRVMATSIAHAKTELLVIGVAENSLQTGAAGLLNTTLSGRLSHQAQVEDFTGKVGQTSLMFTGVSANFAAPRTLLFGLGRPEKLTRDRLREALVAVFKEAKRLKVTNVAFAEVKLDGGSIDVCDFAYLVGETAGVIGYTINHFKTPAGGAKPETRLRDLTLLSPLGTHQAMSAALAEGLTVAGLVNNARNLINLPPCIMTPRKLAECAKQVETDSVGAVKVVIHDKAELERMGAGGLLAVSRGSDQEPVLIEMSYLPADADPAVTLALVGKSVTFDSGGMDLKPADGMRNMKCDMSGGAATLSAIAAIAALKLPIRVRAYMAATENMTGGSAYKPGDVLTTLAGLTVEVDNTDAEGRLTLADAIEFARRQGVTHILDLATLTGAVRACCGSVGAGGFSNNQEWLGEVISAAATVGEKIAALPFWDEFADANKSPIADLKNSGGASFGAGSATAAWFLRKFAGEDIPWVHLDIASVAFRESAHGADPAGGTGWGVRTAIQVARNLAARSSAQKK